MTPSNRRIGELIRNGANLAYQYYRTVSRKSFVGQMREKFSAVLLHTTCDCFGTRNTAQCITRQGPAVEMPRLWESDKERRFPTAAWKSQTKERPDFPTFPQLLLRDIIKMSKTKTADPKGSALAAKQP